MLLMKTYMCSEQLPAPQPPWVVHGLVLPFCSRGGPGCRCQPYGSKAQCLTRRPSRGLRAGERPSVCFAGCLLLPEPITLHTCVSLPRATRCFCLRSPRTGCTPAGVSVLSLPPSILHFILRVLPARSVARGILHRPMMKSCQRLSSMN